MKYEPFRRMSLKIWWNLNKMALANVTYRNIFGKERQANLSPVKSLSVPSRIEISSLLSPEFYPGVSVVVRHNEGEDLIVVEFADSVSGRILEVARLENGKKISLLGSELGRDKRAGVYVRHGIPPFINLDEIDIAKYIVDRTESHF